MNTRKKSVSAIEGFTLIELLAVLAIIAILAAILFPVVGKVRESAGETAGRAQFSQWGQAFELFRQDYGFYPDFSSPAGTAIATDDLYVNRAGNSENPAYDGNRFYEVLTGRIGANSEGTPGDRIGPSNDGFRAGNSRAARFYTFGDREIEGGGPDTIIIRDHFGNGDIVVLFDRDQSGVITVGGANEDYTFPVNNLPPVRSVRTGETFQLSANEFPATGVRAGVIFYSAGYGNRLLTSWQ